MRGTKRLGVFDTNSETNDSASAAEPSQPQALSTPQLDVHRAALSQQHVRALNSQFASWVQSQFQNHPDELWEDGVHDYLSHASNIMEKFTDVVKWLKANAEKGESASVVGSHSGPKLMMPDIKTQEPKSQPENTGFFPMTTTSFVSSWSPRPLPNTETPFIFGFQSSTPVQNDASNDADDETELEQPSSPSVKKTEEKGIIVVHEVKCKLYVKSIDPADKDTWKDKGMGNLSIKCREGIEKGAKEAKPTIIVRNDVGKLLLNALLYPGIKTNLQKNSLVAIFHTAVDDCGNDGGNNGTAVARTFLIKTKTEEDRNKLATTIQEYAPPA